MTSEETREAKDLEKKLSHLRSLHQLLDVNSTETSSATGKPLSGQEVKVPLTSKAFFEGMLEPTKINEAVIRTVECEKEQVLVNVGKGIMIELDRNETCNYIKQQMDQVQNAIHSITEIAAGGGTSNNGNQVNARSNNADKKKKDDGGTFKVKKGFLIQAKRKSKPTILKSSHGSNTGRIHKETETISTSMESVYKTPIKHNILPFMEIKEEYDKDGNQIKAEAMDVSQELIKFQRELKSKKAELDRNKNGGGVTQKQSLAKDEKDQIVDTLLDNLPTDQHVDVAKHEEKAFNNLHVTIENKANSVEYEEISSRLQRLILLEEEEERKKAENMKSSKRIRGSGWAKGFLGSTTSTNKNRQAAITNKKDPSISSSKKAHLVENPNYRPQVSTSQVNGANKRVQFTPSNEVKEIPRIGTRSIFPQNNMQSPKVQRETVSIGGVVERNQTPNNINTLTSKLKANQNPVNENLESTTEQPKMSRFAQRRHQQRP